LRVENVSLIKKTPSAFTNCSKKTKTTWV